MSSSAHTSTASFTLGGPVQRRTMVVLIVMQIIGTVGVGVAPSIGVLLAGEVTDNEAWAGLARTASSLGAAFLGIPLGNLAARFGRRVALSSGWFIAAAGAALLVWAAQLSLVVPLFIGLLLIGSGSAVSLQARFAATDLAEPRRKAKSLALVVWVGTIGSVLGPNLGVPGEVISAGNRADRVRQCVPHHRDLPDRRRPHRVRDAAPRSSPAASGAHPGGTEYGTAKGADPPSPR